jgi:mannose-6-phosphate isomerase
MYRIKGVIQHYDWGGNTFLPKLLNVKNSTKKPFAEYWLGVHAGGPAEVELGEGAKTSLSNLLNSDKPKHLGSAVWKRFNGLPFLLKILDVKDMLSIQVHPNKIDAEKGFIRENDLKISLEAPHRNYKDDNHKPEVMVALSEFWLLHGFVENIGDRILQYPFLQKFSSYFEQGGIKGLYKFLMELSQEQIDEILSEHAVKITDHYKNGDLDKSSPDFWAARAILNGRGKIDRGIFSIYLFNILKMQPGEAIFQGARMPHAYLEGQNIELMANSDNVLRAGLTSKHMDIPELLANTDFVETRPSIMKGGLNGEWVSYPCPVEDFSIASLNLSSNQVKEWSLDAPSIILLLKGQGKCSGISSCLSSGTDAFFVDPGEKVSFEATENSLLFRASVPL